MSDTKPTNVQARKSNMMSFVPFARFEYISRPHDLIAFGTLMEWIGRQEFPGSWSFDTASKADLPVLMLVAEVSFTEQAPAVAFTLEFG